MNCGATIKKTLNRLNINLFLWINNKRTEWLEPSLGIFFRSLLERDSDSTEQKWFQHCLPIPVFLLKAPQTLSAADERARFLFRRSLAIGSESSFLFGESENDSRGGCNNSYLFISIRYQLLTVGVRRQIGSAIKSLQQNLFHSHSSMAHCTVRCLPNVFSLSISFRLEKLFEKKQWEKHARKFM